MAQNSILRIIIDSRKAKKDIDDVDKSLKGVETQGDKTSKKVKDLGGTLKESANSANGAKDAISNFDGSLAGLGRTLGSSKALLTSTAIGIAAVTGAAVGSLGALAGVAVAYANNAKEIQNLATVADMGVVEFQRMAIAAQQVGITSEQLSDQVKDFNEKLGEFVLTGKGEATDAFELLQKHSKMSGEEIKKFALEMQEASGGKAMQMYINKLEEAGVSSEQMSFLTENMANDFTKLLPIFADNGAAIEAWGDAAERAGAIMDEQAIKKSQELQTQTALLELQLKGMSNTVLSAVIPALVDIADAFFQDSEQGNTFKQVGDALAVTLKLLASTAVVVGNAFYLVGDAIGAGAASMMSFLRGDFAGAAQIVKDNYNNAVDSVANSMEKIDKMFTGGTASSVKSLQIKQPKIGARPGVTTGLDEFAKGEEAKTKKAKSESDKRAREAERVAKEIARIETQYSTDEQKRKIKLEEEIQNLRKYGMEKYIDLAKNRYNEEEKLIKMKFEYDLVQYRATEEQKLRFSMNIREQEIKANTGLTSEQRKLSLKSLDFEFKHELGNLKLAKQRRIFNANEFQFSEIERIKKRYALERSEIERNLKLSEDERKALIDASHALQSMDESKVRDSAISDYRSVMGFEESPLIKQYEVLQRMRELDLINEEQYQKSKLIVQAKYMASYAETMFGNMAQLVDENSKTYAVLFAAQKAFAVAQALINIPAAYSKAYDAVVGTPFIGPYIAPAVGAGAAAIQVAQAASIKSTNMQGFSSGGYTGAGAVHQFAGAVHKGEVVFSQNDIAKSGGVQAVENARINGIQNQASAPQQVSVNPQIVLLDERDSLDQYMLSPAGEKSIMKVLQRNGISR